MDLRTKKIMKERTSLKFKNLGIDDDTKLISEKEMNINGYDVLHQAWI